MIDRRAMLGLLPGLTVAGPSARAQSTAKQVRLIVPYPTGGPTDAAARIIAESLRGSGPDAPPALIENKPGGAGTIGTRFVRNAAPDGLTLLLGNNQTHATAPFLIKDAGYDPLADFTPIAGIGSFAHVLVVRKDLGAANVADVLALARDNPGKLNYGSTGIGSGSHLAMELLLQRTATRMQHVPYQGAAQMAGDIAAGRLGLALAILPSVLAGITSGQMLALAVASPRRAPQLPDVPTLKEVGIEGADSESWLAIFGPKGLPAGIVRVYEGALAIRLGQTDVRKTLENLGIAVNGRPADLLQLTLPKEIERWRTLIQSLGLKPE